MGRRRQRKAISTIGPVEHPGRKLQLTATSSGQSAAEDDAVRTTDRLMDRHSKAKPGMPAIENLTELRPVGVLESGCTTRVDHIRVLTGNRRIGRCLYRKLDSAISVVKAAEDGL
jgi:hypothetical protein